MAITHAASEEGMRVDITISGRFDYKISQAFRDIYQKQPVSISIDYHIDLSAAEFMDSSALGMLLLIREFAKSHGGSVVLEQPSPQVSSILKGANFDELFRINSGIMAA